MTIDEGKGECDAKAGPGAAVRADAVEPQNKPMSNPNPHSEEEEEEIPETTPV